MWMQKVVAVAIIFLNTFSQDHRLNILLSWVINNFLPLKHSLVLDTPKVLYYISHPIILMRRNRCNTTSPRTQVSGAFFCHIRKVLGDTLVISNHLSF